MMFDFDSWHDPQQAKPAGKCPCCGREIYSLFSNTCYFCQMDVETEEVMDE